MTKTELREVAEALGFFALGVCDAQPAPHLDFYRSWLRKGYQGTMSYLDRHSSLKEDPRGLLPSCRSVLVAALSYAQEPSEDCYGSPKIARYARGRDYHRVMRGKLRKLAGRLDGEFRICVDSAPLMERDYARLAGIGWFGKNTCLIDSRRGSWFVLGCILSSQRFEPDPPAEGGCGTCARCIEACPTGAIVFEDGRWQLDSRRCISYLTIEHRGEIDPQLTHKIGDWTFGCDVCQEVCPFNMPRPGHPERARPSDEPGMKPRDWPNLTELAVIQPDRWDDLTSGSAVRRAGYDGLRRNAAANLSNKTCSKS